MYKFVFRRRFLLFVVMENITANCWNIRLFTKNGPMIYSQMGETQSSDWATRTTLHLGLLMLLHVSEGKSTTNQGWHVIFSKIQFKKIYGGFSVEFIRPKFHLTPTPSKTERRIYGHFAR